VPCSIVSQRVKIPLMLFTRIGAEVKDRVFSVRRNLKGLRQSSA